MANRIFSAVAMVLLFSGGVAAQAHSHGAQDQAGGTAQPADSSQGMMQQHMQQMEQRMQGMQQMMQSHSQEGGMQGMQQMRDQQGAAAMGGGEQMRMQSQSCLASGPQAGLSALLMGPVGGLGLTDVQRSALQEILARAQDEALETLTAEQREQLVDQPSEVGCPRAPAPSTSPTGG